MENLLFTLIPDWFKELDWLGLVLGIIVGIIVIFIIYSYNKLFDPERPGGPLFFVKAPENRVMYVLRGRSFSGRIILPSKNLCVIKDKTRGRYWIKKRKELTLGEQRKVISQKSILGLYWIGIPPFYSIYYRMQEWQEWNLDVNKNRNILISRDEKTPYLIATPFEYAMSVFEAESKNEVPLDVEFTVIVEPIDATLPIFENDDAYGQLQRFVIATAVLFIKTETFETLGGNIEEESGEIKQGSGKIKDRKELNDYFSMTIKSLNDSIPGREDSLGITDLLGYRIIGAELNTVAISGEHKKELLKASTATYVAGEEAKALKLKGQGEKEYAEQIALGQKATYDVRVNFLKDVSRIPGAMPVEERAATPNLTTLVESDSKKKPLISIGND